MCSCLQGIPMILDDVAVGQQRVLLVLKMKIVKNEK
jgi:hypothetical protein